MGDPVLPYVAAFLFTLLVTCVFDPFGIDK